jgi:hypothetical protein
MPGAPSTSYQLPACIPASAPIRSNPMAGRITGARLRSAEPNRSTPLTGSSVSSSSEETMNASS